MYSGRKKTSTSVVLLRLRVMELGRGARGLGGGGTVCESSTSWFVYTSHTLFFL